MQRMIMIPAERYDRMLKSYDEAMDEIYRLREELRAAKASQDDAIHQLELYAQMDKHGCDMDTAELLMQDLKEGGCPGGED